jgi:2-aminoadipate transaminase
MSGGIAQFQAAPGVINLALGHPAPELLPVESIAEIVGSAVLRHGAGGLDYGDPQGPQPTIEALRRRLARVDARVPHQDQLAITAGTSAAIDRVASLFTRPGDVVLVEAPTYHLALRILSDHPIDLVAVPGDADGLDADALARETRRVRAEGRTVRLVYSVPTFSNPTGASLSADRRRALAQVLRTEGLLLVEDDAYRELAYDGEAPPSVWSEDPGRVLRLGTFSKSLAPGLRVGFVTAPPELIQRFTESGLADSGGGAAHFAAVVVGDVMASGLYATTVERLRSGYRARRDALAGAVADHLATFGARWTVPSGGYFLWLTLPGLNTSTLLSAASAVGVEYVPGVRFYLDGQGGEDSLRLAFSRYSADELREGVARLARAVGSATRRGTK